MLADFAGNYPAPHRVRRQDAVRPGTVAAVDATVRRRRRRTGIRAIGSDDRRVGEARTADAAGCSTHSVPSSTMYSPQSEQAPIGDEVAGLPTPQPRSRSSRRNCATDRRLSVHAHDVLGLYRALLQADVPVWIDGG